MSSRGVVTVIRWLIVVAMVIEILVIVGFVFGAYGLGFNLPDFGGRLGWEGQAVMSAEGVLSEPPMVDVDLSWATTSEGTVDASTGMAPVGLGGPFTARLSFWAPTAGERILYVAGRIAGPVLAVVGLWLLFRLVSSVRAGTPFTPENGRRLWMLALVVGIGGTAVGIYSEWLDAWLISRSAAASAFSVQGFISFMPLFFGALLVVLAVAWGRGLALETETEGLV